MKRFVAAILDRAAPPRPAPGRLRRLITSIVPENGENPFLADFRSFQGRIAVAGMYNSLAQTLLKLVAPGVPDTYQGTEEWNLSLVDPDNRRPVDYARLRADLAGIRERLAERDANLAELARSLLAAKDDGRIKLYMIHRTLDYRRQHARLFTEGAYVPLEAEGPRREHIVAFGRQLESETVVAVVPRFLARLRLTGPPVGSSVWAGAWLPIPETWASRGYRNVLTGEVVQVVTREGRPGLAPEAALATFPVALLEATDER
jgi:(1->4)-alpha-D-glucan 1-alpha-D-glucosylmutase